MHDEVLDKIDEAMNGRPVMYAGENGTYYDSGNLPPTRSTAPALGQFVGRHMTSGSMEKTLDDMPLGQKVTMFTGLQPHQLRDLIYDTGIGVTADTVKLIGEVPGARNSILGQALMAMREPISPVYGNAFTNALQASGAGAYARGQNQINMADTASDRILQTDDDIRSARLRREAQEYAQQYPNAGGAYWTYLDTIQKHPTAMNDKKAKSIGRIEKTKKGVSDRREKNIKKGCCLSDWRCKENFTEEDNSILDSYAENLRNYLYTYKPEATEIDSSIDPNEEQIGIMAQDLEQVNPACIKETPEGVKTVDTGKLALMNAGAIADVVRRLQALENKVGA